MAQRIVAADASPLIGLAAAGGFGLLRRLFGTVMVTAAVRNEVLAGGQLPGAAELTAAIRAGWIVVVPTPAGIEAMTDLGVGEASTLLLAARSSDTALVLMDEPRGRAQAQARGIAVTGLVGVLIAARRARLIRRIRPYLDRLAAAGFRLSDELAHAALREAGES